MDYELLLHKYIDHVAMCDGATYILRCSEPVFTVEEIEELERLESLPRPDIDMSTEIADDDLFQCADCGAELDIDESIRVGADLSCELCVEQAGIEGIRRDDEGA